MAWLIAAFPVVAVCDLMHALTYAGMPELIGPNGTSRAIFFWLMGRSVEALALGVVAFGWVLPLRTRGAALALAAGVSVLLVAWGSVGLHLFPATFKAGQGLTGFKVGYEFVLLVANAAIGWLLWRQARRQQSRSLMLMAMSAWLIAIGGISFASYSRPHDFQNLFGHVFKIAAYLCLYAATVASSLNAPFRALQASRQQARESERQLAGIVEMAMDAIVTVGRDQRVRVFNRAAANMFGLPREAAIGQPLSRFLPEALRAAHVSHLEAFATHGTTTRRMGGELQVHGLRASGEVFPLEASISKSGEGEHLLLTAVLRDVTHEHEAERAHAAQRVAEEANRAKSEFISRMSHELRTPLNAILGVAQLLADDTREPLSERQRERVRLSRRAGEHLLRLVDDLLDVARIESGRMNMERVAVPLARVAADAVAFTESLAAAREVALRAPAADAPGPLVLADPVRLRQVLINLLSNGAKYNRPGGHVELRWAATAEQVVAEVIDDGIGMDAQQQAGLFEPFNRLGRDRTGIEGTGIGLHLARQLMQGMGGELLIDSQPGRGTRITLRLLHAPDDAEPAPVPTLMPVPASPAAAGEPAGTVLYVEDDPVNMMVVEHFLERWPTVTLRQAETGADGLAAMREAPAPDVVLLDMQLPDMTGFDVLRALRADPATRGLAVLALSASAMPEDVRAARDAGADGYLTKPIDFVVLEAALTERLPRRG